MTDGCHEGQSKGVGRGKFERVGPRTGASICNEFRKRDGVNVDMLGVTR
jgi:hypothetical protein